MKDSVSTSLYILHKGCRCGLQADQQNADSDLLHLEQTLRASSGKTGVHIFGKDNTSSQTPLLRKCSRGSDLVHSAPGATAAAASSWVRWSGCTVPPLTKPCRRVPVTAASKAAMSSPSSRFRLPDSSSARSSKDEDRLGLYRGPQQCIETLTGTSQAMRMGRPRSQHSG